MNIILFLKGLFIGSTMTIPGVSGGTMAIILGVYEDLIHNVNQIKKEPFKSVLFLCNIGPGGLIGFVAFARVISYLLANPATGIYVRVIFAIIVLCGIPLLVKKSGITKLSIVHILWLFSVCFWFCHFQLFLKDFSPQVQVFHLLLCSFSVALSSLSLWYFLESVHLICCIFSVFTPQSLKMYTLSNGCLLFHCYSELLSVRLQLQMC